MKKISRLGTTPTWLVWCLALVVSLVVPLAVSAATGYSGINLNAITPYSNGIVNIINSILVPVLMAVAFITFLLGIYKYFILGAANESEKADGRKFAMWGVIGFVVILSLWGLVNLVMGTFGLSAGKAPPYPTIGGSATTNATNNYFSNTNQTGTSPGTSGGGTGPTNNTANVIICDVDLYTFAQCQQNCVDDGWNWNSSNNTCSI